MTEFSQPKISIIIPAYKTEKYLVECLNSVSSQTLKDIEVIVIDDCSPDNCGKIADQFASRDGRFSVIHKRKNEGLLLGRKTGVLQAQGKYIMFLDSDDYLFSPSALDELYQNAEIAKSDILMFVCEVVGDVPKEQKDGMRNYIRKGCNMEITGAAEIIEKCVFYSYGYTIWNKLYASPVAKKAYSSVENIYLNSSEDCYAYLTVAFFSKKFKGINTNPIICYRLGSGMTTRDNISLPLFSSFAGDIKVIELLRKIFIQDTLNRGRYKKILKGLEERLTDYAVYRLSQLSRKDVASGFDVLVGQYGIDRIPGIVRYLHKHCNWQKEKLLGLVSARALGVNRGKNAQKGKIGIYFPGKDQGKIPETISLEISVFNSLGYEVVLISDKFEVPDKHQTSLHIHHATVAHAFEENRAEDFKKIIDSENLSIILYQQETDRNVLFDAILFKALGLKLVIKANGIHSSDVKRIANSPSLFHETLSFADALVVPSKLDESYYGIFGLRTIFIPEISSPPKKQQAPQHGRNILWIGRLSEEDENYSDPPKILKKVLEVYPEATLTMLGTEGDPDSRVKLLQEVRELKIESSFCWQENNRNISPTFSRSDLILITSAPESFSLAALEAKGWGLPIVSYSLPYLDIFRNGKEVLAVPQGNIDAAAASISRIFGDESLRHRLSGATHESIEDSMEFSRREWEKVFSFSSCISTKVNRKELNSFFEFLYASYANSLRRSSTELAAKDRQISKLEQNTTNLLRKNSAELAIRDSQISKLMQEVAALDHDLDTLRTNFARKANFERNFRVSKYLKYKFLSRITLGKRREHYVRKYREQKMMYKSIKSNQPQK